MSFGSQYNLNQRLTYLEFLLNNLPPFPPTSTLDEVLTAGSSGNTGQTITLSGSGSDTVYAGASILSNADFAVGTIGGDVMALFCFTSALHMYRDNTIDPNGYIYTFGGTQCNMSTTGLVITNGVVTGNLTSTSLSSSSTLSLITTGIFGSSISLNPTTGDMSLTSAGGSILLTAGNGDAGFSGITLSAPEGDIALNTGGAGYSVTSNARITSTVGYQGKVYHTDQPTTALTYYLTFVQSGGISGFYDPAFDSATLTYNPSTNLLAVAGLQLSGSTIGGTLTAGLLTLGCNESSSRQFQVAMTSNITGLTCSNRRTNGVYTCSIYNVSGSVWTISNVLVGLNKTDYAAPIVMNNGDTAIMTIRTLLTNGVATNYTSVSKFV
jgi:hypothetical protein